MGFASGCSRCVVALWQLLPKATASENSSRSFSAHFTPPKAAAEDDDAFGAHPWKGKQLTSIGKLVTTDKLPVRCVLRRKRLIFNNSMLSARPAHAKLAAQGGTVPSKRGAGREEKMKRSMLPRKQFAHNWLDS